MKRFLVVIFSVVFVTIATLVFAPSFIDWSLYKNSAEKQFVEKTGLNIDIKGNLGFSILPSPRFFVEDVEISSPEYNRGQKLASLDRLEVNLSLMPLFSRKIKVESLSLVSPVISVKRLEDGRLNLITKEIEGLVSSDGQGQTVADIPQVSLDKIYIKDASFNYLDQKNNENFKIQNINLDLSADSLTGPFKAQGSLFYNGNALNFNIETSAYDFDNKIISPKVKLILQPSDIELQYDGIADFSDGFSLQGQTAIRVKDIVNSLSKYRITSLPLNSGVIEAKGLLTADSRSFSYKNLYVNYNKEMFSGEITAKFDPLSYNIKLSSSKGANIAKILKGKYGFKEGRGSVDISGWNNKISLNHANIAIDDQEASITGKYVNYKKEKRPELSLHIASNNLNYDRIISHLPKSSSGGGDIKDFLSSFALPFDLRANIEVSKLIYKETPIKGIYSKIDIIGNSVGLKALQIKDFADTAIKMSGAINNINNASGMTLYLDINSKNISNFMHFFGIDLSNWSKNLRKADIKAKLSGMLDTMDVTTNIKAMGGEIIAKGYVKDFIIAPKIGNLIVQIKHNNMSKLLRFLTSAKVNDENLQKPMDLYVKINQNGDKQYKLNDIKGKISGTALTGNVKINLSSPTPEVSGDLYFGKVVLESVMSLDNNSSDKKSSVRWSKEPLNLSFLHSFNLDLKLSAQSIIYGSWPLKAPEMKITLKNGDLDIIDLNAEVFGGSLNLSSQLKPPKEYRLPIYFESSSEFNNVDIGKLSMALVGTQMVKVSGKSNLNLNIKSSGVSPAALIYDLSGTGIINGSNIILSGVDVTRFIRALSDESKPGDTIMGLWKGSTKGGRTQFKTLDGAFIIKNGVTQISSMILDGEKVRIETFGTVDLPKWYLSTKHKMIIKETKDGISDVPPFEMSFKGPLDNPTQTFGKGLLNDYLNRKVKRKLNDLLGKKLGFPSNDNEPQMQEPASDRSATTYDENQTNLQNNHLNQEENPSSIEDDAEKAIKGLLKNLLR